MAEELALEGRAWRHGEAEMARWPGPQDSRASRDGRKIVGKDGLVP